MEGNLSTLVNVSRVPESVPMFVCVCVCVCTTVCVTVCVFVQLCNYACVCVLKICSVYESIF
jgi:hypothetical protein